MRLPTLLVVLGLGLILAITNSASAADFPKGTFAIKDKEGAAWEVTFDGKGKFSVTREGKAAVSGKYKVTKDELEITEEEGDLAGKGDQQTATYKWKLDGKKLTFTKVKDESLGREAVVTAGPWEMKAK